jgi:Tol biopolymer transport system component
MSEEKKILVQHDSDDEQLDIGKDTTDIEQDEWVESLDEETAEESPQLEEALSVEEPETTTDDIETIEASSTTHDEAIPDDTTTETIDDAVDEIVAEDADKLMQVEDAVRTRQFMPPTVEKRTLFGRIKHFFRAWWQNTRLRNATLITFFLISVAVVLVPFSRYMLLNAVGIRVQASMTIVDSESGRPLKNILVSLQGYEARTNDDGYVSFMELKQGNSTFKVDRKGFAPLEKTLTLGWGTNPLGEQSLLATGARFRFTLKDWLSGAILKDAEATSGEYVGQSDEDGTVELVMGEVADDAEIILSAKGYRNETRKVVDVSDEIIEQTMVPSKKHAFVSNRDGKYDLYTIDVDGKNEKLSLGGTGKEREVPYVLPHQNRDIIAYVSSRDGDTNKDGFILDGLFVVDTFTAETYKITRSEQLQVIGWSGNKLIYVAIVEGVSAGNSQRSKIVSYDLDTKERIDLASSNYFNDVKLVDGTVYYAVSSYAVPRAQAKLFSVTPDGKDKQTVVDEQVWSIGRADFETMFFNTESNEWYEKKLDGVALKLDTQPVQQESRIYTVSPDGTRAVWVDVRDGKGVLLSYRLDDKKEAAVKITSGLMDPVYWINDSQVVYRVTTSQETADYVVSLDGGEAQKIADVVGNRSRYFN